MVTAPVVVGVDPGGASTGVVVRHGSRLVDGCTLHRDTQTTPAYLAEVAAAVLGYVSVHHATVVAVEDTVPPNPHLGVSNPAGIIATAQVLGAVLLAVPDAVLVPPAGHGRRSSGRVELLARYPVELVGVREQHGTGGMRHMRSAWDIAAAGALLARAHTNRQEMT